MIKAGIVGVSGYAGAQLLLLLLQHKEVEVDFIAAHSKAGEEIQNLYGNFAKIYEKKCLTFDEAYERLEDIDVIFTALPHSKSAKTVKLAYDKGVKVIDLGADFRLDDTKEYEKWYKVPFQNEELIDESVYGLPEIKREEIKGKKVVANPGCYATASILGTYPLVKAGLIDEKSIIIDAKSGTSGAGRSEKMQNLYCEVNESIKAYAVANHRHTAEIEQELTRVSNEDIKLLFTPHLIPMNRGILSVIYASLNEGVSGVEVKKAFEEAYKDEYFVRILDTAPETKWVKGTNFCDISFEICTRTNRVIVMSVIDNLMKGAASQAVQNMNILFDIDEKEGLELLAMFP